MSRSAEPQNAAFSYYPVLRRVKTYVEANLDEGITRQQVAQVAGLEEKYFSTFFRRKTGMSFTAWVAQLRVSRAKHMMQQRDHTITQVALAVGFRDLRTFERAFKRHTGMTPRSFKSSVRP